ncbi:MAG: hypothetical protein O6949_07375 [Chloroflexi bacterium]|nr:hypothetical protein [Chloroflexota bacterium]
MNASVINGEFVFATTFDNTLLRIIAVLIALTAVGFILATKGTLGHVPQGRPKLLQNSALQPPIKPE